MNTADYHIRFREHECSFVDVQHAIEKVFGKSYIFVNKRRTKRLFKNMAMPTQTPQGIGTIVLGYTRCYVNIMVSIMDDKAYDTHRVDLDTEAEESIASESDDEFSDDGVIDLT